MMLKYLERMDSDIDFSSILEEVPESLNGLYQRLLTKLSKDLIKRERMWIREIITWTVTAKRDLKLSELEVGIARSRNIRAGKDAGVPTIFRLETTLSKMRIASAVSLHYSSLKPGRQGCQSRP